MDGSMLQIADAVAENPWKFCLLCGTKIIFPSAVDFKNHLRMQHCTQEGGSFVCNYGRNNVCPSLPFDGVNWDDYETHVEKVHIQLNGRAKKEEPVDFTSLHKMTSRNTHGLSPKIKYKDDQLPAQGLTNWTQFSCQNLSAVLNDPRKTTRQTDFFTRLWGEGFVPQKVVPLTLLPNTPRSYFVDHLKRYEIKSMQHEKLKRAILAPHSGNRGKDARAKHSNLPNNDNDIIPEVFFQADFNLEEPSTFNAVLPWSSIQPLKSPSHEKLSRRTSSKLLQEKLAHYLDVAEGSLAQQISTKSGDFFDAMRSQETLQTEVQTSCTEVQVLREQLKGMRSRLVEEPLNVMRLFRLRYRYEAVEEKLELMAVIHQTQPTIQLLLATADFVSALDMIDTSLEVLNQELAGLQCFRHLGSQLTEMQKVIERIMATDFLDFAVAILNQPHSDNVQLLYEGEKLLAVVLGLLRQKKSDFLTLYKREAFTIIKKTIKQTAHDVVPEETEASEEQNIKFADYIRSLEHNEWLMVLEAVFCVVLQILKNMKVIHEGLSRVFASAAGIRKGDEKTSEPKESLFGEDNLNAFLAPSECEKFTQESKDLLCKACELAQSRSSNLIIMRAKEGALDRLSSKDFVVLARIVEKFALDCEEVSGRQSQNLRGTLLSQAKRFIERFHEERKHKLSNILDTERWKQVDVPREIQELIDTFSEGLDKTIASSHNNSSFFNSESTMNPMLQVRGQEFAVVGTLLILLKIIMEYCQCVDDVPMLVTDIMTRLCEVLTMFNSRSCQLVLHAGALQTVGLRSISAKHLMLVAQCLEVIILHTNTIKNHFELRLTPRQYVMLSQFDQILKDYSNHRHKLLSKITNLMEEIFNAHFSSYELKPPMPSKTMRGVVNQIKKLRETMAAIMSEQQLECDEDVLIEEVEQRDSVLEYFDICRGNITRSLFRDVRRCLKNCLAEKLAELNVNNDGGPQHGLVTSDIVFYSANLKQYAGFKDLDHKCDGIWTTVKELRSKLKEQKSVDISNTTPVDGQTTRNPRTSKNQRSHRERPHR